MARVFPSGLANELLTLSPHNSSMQVNYAPFIDRVIKRYEGGYGWDRSDPGGPTNFGITCYDLAEHRGQKMTSMSAWAPMVRDMPLAEAEMIYRNKYAKAIRFDDLPAGVDCAMLDYGINSGTSRAVRVTRALLGLPVGGMDLALYDALKKTDPTKFVHNLNAERLRFLQSLRTWHTFGHGWTSRVNDLTTYCDHVIAGAGAAAPAPRVMLTSAKGTSVKPNGRGAAGAAVMSSVGLASGLVGSWEWGLAIAALGVTAAVIYELYQVYKTNKANETIHVG